MQVSRTLLLERERVHCCHSAPHASPRAVCGRYTRRAAAAARRKNGLSKRFIVSITVVLSIIEDVWGLGTLRFVEECQFRTLSFKDRKQYLVLGLL